jgi:hypothetical protein
VQESIVRETEQQSDTEQTGKLKSRRQKWLAILAVSAILLTLPVAWLAYYRQAESPLNALEKQGSSIQREVMGPIWFCRFAEKWKLPVPKQIVQFDSSTATNEDLAIVAKESSLRVLFLMGSHVTDAGLAHLREHPNIWQVFLKDVRITDAGVRHLGQVPNLRALWLRGTEVTDAGLVHLKGLKNLSSLGLADTCITDDGLAILPGFGCLTNIELDRAYVTDEGLKHLYEMKQLIRVSLNGTRVTSEGIASLKAAIPGMTVRAD